MARKITRLEWACIATTGVSCAYFAALLVLRARGASVAPEWFLFGILPMAVFWNVNAFVIHRAAKNARRLPAMEDVGE
ncbi:MAG TPA: hypothetical protein VM452_10100 [Caulifigura sp.]|nr:hypothetical protein [Caulifigura sp.]